MVGLQRNIFAALHKFSFVLVKTFIKCLVIMDLNPVVIHYTVIYLSFRFLDYAFLIDLTGY